MARLLTDEQHDYLVKIQVGKTTREVAQQMNDRYGLSLTPQQIKSYRGNHHLNSGLTGHFQKGHVPFNKGRKFPNMAPNSGQFKKGNRPSNYAPIGTIRYTTDGYPRIKVGEPNKWEYLHRQEWERHHGPIPKGYSVVFLDGDQTNWNISNLACLSRNEIVRMNQQHYFTSNTELTLAGISVVKVNNKLKELQDE